MLKANCLHCVTAAELHNIFLEMLKTFATVLIYTSQKFAFVSKHKRRSTVEASKKKKKKKIAATLLHSVPVCIVEAW